MKELTTAFLADPKAWVAALMLLLSPVGWLWRHHAKVIAELRARVEGCEKDRAVLNERLIAANEKIAVERGRVDALTDLFKQEAHIG